MQVARLHRTIPMNVQHIRQHSHTAMCAPDMIEKLPHCITIKYPSNPHMNTRHTFNLFAVWRQRVVSCTLSTNAKLADIPAHATHNNYSPQSDAYDKVHTPNISGAHVQKVKSSTSFVRKPQRFASMAAQWFNSKKKKNRQHVQNFVQLLVHALWWCEQKRIHLRMSICVCCDTFCSHHHHLCAHFRHGVPQRRRRRRRIECSGNTQW